MTPAQQYAGDRKGTSEIAVIQSYHGSLLGEEYHATISGYSSKPTFRPTLEVSVKAGYAYTVKCDASEGKATVFVSQETRML
jgi:hypothetical protein